MQTHRIPFDYSIVLTTLLGTRYLIKVPTRCEPRQHNKPLRNAPYWKIEREFACHLLLAAVYVFCSFEYGKKNGCVSIHTAGADNNSRYRTFSVLDSVYWNTADAIASWRERVKTEGAESAITNYQFV